MASAAVRLTIETVRVREKENNKINGFCYREERGKKLYRSPQADKGGFGWMGRMCG